MERGDRSSTGSAVQAVRALMNAHAENRVADVLAVVHPEVRWYPASRPARSMYTGHAGTIELMDDLRTSLGSFRVRLDEVSERPDGRVEVHGARLTLTDGGDVRETTPFDLVVTLRDGLVIELESMFLGD
jgi:hypothetical protein